MMPAALVALVADGRVAVSRRREGNRAGAGISGRTRPLACRAVIRDAAALGSRDHDDAAGQRRDGGAARRQGRRDARRRHATSWQIHLPVSDPAGHRLLPRHGRSGNL
jgi:hypothetical protein